MSRFLGRGLTATTLVLISGVAHAGLLSGLLTTDPIANFDFNGTYTFYDTAGGYVGPPDQPITGNIALDTVTLGGTASMQGNFFNLPFTAQGDLSAQVAPTGLLGFGQCAGAAMCAYSQIDFLWNGNHIPVVADFTLKPTFQAGGSISPASRSAPVSTWRPSPPTPMACQAPRSLRAPLPGFRQRSTVWQPYPALRSAPGSPTLATRRASS